MDSYAIYQSANPVKPVDNYREVIPKLVRFLLELGTPNYVLKYIISLAEQKLNKAPHILFPCLAFSIS